LSNRVWFFVRRLMGAILTVWFIVTLLFVLLRVTPGDPAQIWLGDYATPELLAEVRRELLLDRPILVQYGHYLGQLLSGELGQSYRTRQSVMRQLVQQYPYTLQLTLASFLVAVGIGIPIGIIAGIHRGRIVDLVVMGSAVFWLSAPSFWLAILLLLLFAVYFPIFPLIGAGQVGNFASVAWHLVLPAIALGSRGMAVIARMTRGTMVEILGEDFVRTARAKGLAERVVLYKHALRNALGPVISVAGIDLITLLGGAVVIETVFSRPGIGRLLVVSVTSRDYPTLQGAILFFAVGVVLINMLTNLAYSWSDPRVEYS
jgi:peptide/nickel transport system permease protein